MKHVKWYFLFFLIFLNLMIWQVSSGTLLKVVFLDVGQGDAILIEDPQYITQSSFGLI